MAIGTSSQTESRKSVVRTVRSASSFHRTKLAFMVAAFVALVLSVVVWFGVDREQGLFIGLWVPAIHSLGTLVLVGEEDRHD